MTDIEGIKIVPVRKFCDDRGFFSEVYRDSDGTMGRIRQVSYTETHPEIIKAFHYHKKQSDVWFVCKGMAQIGLIDLRKESPTEGNLQTIFAGEDDPKIVYIPPMVAHGYKVLGNEKVGLFYLTDFEYDGTDPDEHRIPWNETLYNWETKNC